jgi:hypothetical protein
MNTTKGVDIMKELAQKMVDSWKGIVLEEIWVINAISAYCYAHHIELTEDEEFELFDIIWNELC